eukprot:TRINITY_DN5955_c0_g1_i1.p1 TRINITY_DN5955_c0_g1~~TRINITY_DN5955_c0_g1_i1.p1  ORF type:complete len:1736 (+),score=349.71 TRINITY_DN5955_c0_g1_i1:74-5281(+)
MSHRSTKGAPKPATADLTAGGESLADLARERRDSRSYTIDYTGMGQQMIPAPTALVQNTQKQSKKYLSELKGSGSTEDAQKARKLLRSLSVPFLNSWDFNSIDITSQMNIPGVGNLKNYLKKRWNRTSNRAIRPARFRADPRRIHELSSESPEETAMFREKRRSSMKEKTLDLLMEETPNGVSRVAAGTPIVLVQCLLDVENTDDSYAHTVFVTHDTWINSADMLTILSEIYFGRRTSDWLSKSQLEDVEFVKVMKKRIIKLLTLWITEYFADFRDSAELSRQFKEFLYELGGAGKEEKRMADILLDTFMSSMAGASSSSTPDASSGAVSPQPAAPMNKRRSGKNIFVRERSPRKLNFLDLDPKTLARQFCLFDQKMIARVRFQELVAGRWNKGKGENVVALRDRSNLITQWVATEILQTPNTKQRIVVLSNFLELCMNLLEMRNYKTSFNVYSGLRMPQVARLNKTWNGLDPKTMAVWQDLESQLRGLATFFEQSLAAPSPKILPVSLLLRFLEVKEQEPDTHRRYVHMINFNKMRAVADLVKPFIDSQSVQYGFEENAMIQVYLEKYLTVIDSQHKLTKMSRDIEGDSGNPASVVVSPRAQKHVSLNTGGSSSSSKPSKASAGSKAADAAAKKVAHQSESAEKPLIQNDPMNGKTREQIHQEIHNELVGKWKRPLAKCSVGSDLPRLIAKILVIDARGHTLYKCREDRKKIYLAREMNMFLRCMAQQLESTKDAKAIEKSFRDYFTVEARSEASTDIIKETGLFVSEVLGESSVVTSLLKITASQGIISPAWVRLKLFILAQFPFKDARKGWRVYIIFEPFFVTICHIKKEMSSEEMAGSRPFEFTWELKMVFDRKLEQMLECSLVISELSISEDMPSDRQLLLTEVLKPWRGPSFRSSIQYGLEGESEESSFMPEEAVAAAAQKKAAAEKAASTLSPSTQKKTQSEKRIVVESVFTGTTRRAKSDAKIQTKKALITTPDDSDNLDPGFGGHESDRSSPARLKRKKSSKDKLDAKSDKEDGYHSGGSHRRSGSGSKDKSLAKSKSRETLQDAYDPNTPGRRTSSGDKNKILLTGDKGSPSAGSPVSHMSSSKRSGSLTKDETTKIVHHSSTATFGSPSAPVPQSTGVAPPIMSPVSPRRAPQNAISKASELLHDESESIDDVAINHLRRLAPGSRGRSTSVGKTGQPITSPTAVGRAPEKAAAASTATPPASIGASLSSPNLGAKRLAFNDSAVVNDGAASPLRKDPASSPTTAHRSAGSSGAIAGSGSDESSSASNTGSGDNRKRVGSTHDRLNTSVRKSLELKNLDVVRAFTEEAEAVEAGGSAVSGRKKSARKSMPAQHKTPRGASSKSDRSAVTSSGILSDPEGSPPSASRLSVAAASLHLGSSSARSSSSKSSHHHHATGSSSARPSSSVRHSKDKDKDKDREKDKERQSSRSSQQSSSSGHRSTAITPRDPLDSARDRLDREAERERERQKEKERDSHERRGDDAPRSSSKDANGSPRSGSPRLDSTPRGSPRDKALQASPGAGDADAPASMSSSSGHLRRSRTSSRSSRDIRVFESSSPSTPNQSTPTTPTAAEAASEAGPEMQPTSARRRPRAPSLSIDERAPYNVQHSNSVARDGTATLATVEENSPRRDSVESAGRSTALPVPPPPVPLGMISSRYSAPDISTATGSAATKTVMPVSTNRIPQRPSAIALAAVAAQGGPALAEWDVTESDASDADSSVEDPFH